MSCRICCACALYMFHRRRVGNVLSIPLYVLTCEELTIKLLWLWLWLWLTSESLNSIWMSSVWVIHKEPWSCDIQWFFIASNACFGCNTWQKTLQEVGKHGVRSSAGLHRSFCLTLCHQGHTNVHAQSTRRFLTRLFIFYSADSTNSFISILTLEVLQLPATCNGNNARVI